MLEMIPAAFRFTLVSWGAMGFLLLSAVRADESPSGRALLERYCGDCHFGDESEGDLDLEAIAASGDVFAHLEQWEKSLNMARAALMPPADADQPTPAERRALARWMESRLATIDCAAHARPGRPTIRRLNRTEYGNTIRDLMGVDFDTASHFPADDVGYGFDNIGDVLTLPPAVLEQYLKAAETIVSRALSNDAARRRLLRTLPGEPKSGTGAARAILRRFASRAFRRPVEEGDLNRLLRLAVEARQAGMSKEDALGIAFQAVLVSPRFLFRLEADPGPDDADGIRELDDWEIATRLSYFLWSTMPDDELFRLAREGKLRDRKTLRSQVRRMLRDARSDALVRNFGGQWLTLRRIDSFEPDPKRFGRFDAELREAMLEETYWLFRTIMRDDRSVLEFLTADYTFVNERLARHYGIKGVHGKAFRKVKLDGHRRGVATHASILAVTSNPTRTSPVKRGKWIMETLLGTPPPPPPAAAPLADDGHGELLGTLRERMEQHRSNPECATCHVQMDAIGFGLENFDAVGRWREKDGRNPIDPSGTLPGGLEFSGPAELMQILAQHRRDDFCRTLVKKLLTYAVGRGVTAADYCTVSSIVRDLKQHDYRFQPLIEAIVLSDAFLKRSR